MCRHIHAIADTLENKRGRRRENNEREKEREREREKRWLIRTCVMTIANHLLNGADTYWRTSLYLLTIAKGSFKSEPKCPSHIIILFNLPRGPRNVSLKPPVSLLATPINCLTHTNSNRNYYYQDNYMKN